MVKLVDQIKLPLSDLQKEKIEIIDNFDFSNVAKKMNEEFGIVLTEQYLAEGIENLKKYYVAALLDPLNHHAASEYVDPFWHVHVLFTKEYTEFCESVYGQYLHHTPPLDKEDGKVVSHFSKLYTYTTDIFTQIFHEVDPSWWPSLKTEAKRIPAICVTCYNEEIKNEDICKQSLFPVKPELKYVS